MSSIEINKDMLTAARALAQSNYDTWGCRIIEKFSDQVLVANLQRYTCLNHWAAEQSKLHKEKQYMDQQDDSWEDDGGIETDREAYRKMIE